MLLCCGAAAADTGMAELASEGSFEAIFAGRRSMTAGFFWLPSNCNVVERRNGRYIEGTDWYR